MKSASEAFDAELDIDSSQQRLRIVSDISVAFEYPTIWTLFADVRGGRRIRRRYYSGASGRFTREDLQRYYYLAEPQENFFDSQERLREGTRGNNETSTAVSPGTLVNSGTVA